MKPYSPVISVLLPVFKTRKEWITDSINSILNQTYADFELLVLYEPVSGDGLYDYLKSISDSRIKVITLPEKYGLPRSLNKGIDLSRGKYIARMDADDISMPDRFAIQLKYMETHPQIDILGGVLQVMNTDRHLFNLLIDSEARKARMIFENAGVGHPSAFYRRESFERVHLRYDESMRGSEDYRLWVDAIINGLNIDSVSDVVLRYREHDNQASNILSKMMVDWDADTRKKLCKLMFGLSDKESDVLLSFGKAQRIAYPATDYEQLFEQLLIRNERSGFCDKDLFQKEVSWQWLCYALYQVKKCREFSLLRSGFTRHVVLKRNNFCYAMKQARALVKVIHGKIVIV